MEQFIELRLKDMLFTRWLIWLTAFVIAIPFFFAMIFALREVQSRYIPVIVDFEVTRFEHLNPTRIEIWGAMTKRFEFGDGLPMCRYQSMNWFVRGPGGVDDARQWSLERPLGQIVNRQPGRQPFGPWIIDYARMPDADEAFAVITHWCLGFWHAETKIGPLRLHARR